MSSKNKSHKRIFMYADVFLLVFENCSSGSPVYFVVRDVRTMIPVIIFRKYCTEIDTGYHISSGYHFHRIKGIRILRVSAVLIITVNPPTQPI